ncbi:MAG: DUF3854 domain-containing protein [Planctomycetales bacterium]|nr:DUF3854 domain-containing protein [Planctomycetales bacterium]
MNRKGKSHKKQPKPLPISPAHRKRLERDSGLTFSTLRGAGLYTVRANRELARSLGVVSVPKSWGPVLVYPYFDAKGGKVIGRVEPLYPLLDERIGECREFRNNVTAINRAYIPRRVWAKLSEVTEPVVITDRETNALAATQRGVACIAVRGVHAWRDTSSDELIRELMQIDWLGRQVCIAFDMFADNCELISREERDLAAVLSSRGAVVKIVRVPGLELGPFTEPQRLDHFLAAQGRNAKKRLHELMENAGQPQPPDGSEMRRLAKHADPADEAQEFLATREIAGMRTLHFLRGDYYTWIDGCYRVMSADEIEAQLIVELNKRWRRTSKQFNANVAQQVRAQATLPSSTSAPSWLGSAPHAWSPSECVATRTRVVHLPSLIDGVEPREIPATPAFLNFSATDVEFDRDAPPPERWLRFLAQVFGDDDESIRCLQDWFGYLLATETKQQKILMIVGPKRSGKGTIGRVLAALVGAENITAPTMHSLTTNFGLSSLIGKCVAIVSDARLSGRSDQATIVERLLSISGEDAITVDRKYREAVTQKLPTRFVLLTNELPKIFDASGAFVSRFVVLRTTQSFFGAEDAALTSRLLSELPGILRWAIEGWARLRDRGCFAQPAAGREDLAQWNALASPISAFVADCCVVGPGESVSIDALYERWTWWNRCQGRERDVPTKQVFGRDLRAAVPSISDSRPTDPENGRVRIYRGIGLRSTGPTGLRPAAPTRESSGDADAPGNRSCAPRIPIRRRNRPNIC